MTLNSNTGIKSFTHSAYRTKCVYTFKAANSVAGYNATAFTVSKP